MLAGGAVLQPCKYMNEPKPAWLMHAFPSRSTAWGAKAAGAVCRLTDIADILQRVG